MEYYVYSSIHDEYHNVDHYILKGDDNPNLDKFKEFCSSIRQTDNIVIDTYPIYYTENIFQIKSDLDFIQIARFHTKKDGSRYGQYVLEPGFIIHGKEDNKVAFGYLRELLNRPNYNFYFFELTGDYIRLKQAGIDLNPSSSIDIQCQNYGRSKNPLHQFTAGIMKTVDSFMNKLDIDANEYPHYQIEKEINVEKLRAFLIANHPEIKVLPKIPPFEKVSKEIGLKGFIAFLANQIDGAISLARKNTIEKIDQIEKILQSAGGIATIEAPKLYRSQKFIFKNIDQLIEKTLVDGLVLEDSLESIELGITTFNLCNEVINNYYFMTANAKGEGIPYKKPGYMYSKDMICNKLTQEDAEACQMLMDMIVVHFLSDGNKSFVKYFTKIGGFFPKK